VSARLTIALNESPVLAAWVRSSRTKRRESFTVNAIVASGIGTGARKRRAACRSR
jgi:hypothetical protein